MPWNGLRSKTAGGRASRRQSVLENRDLPVPNNDAEGPTMESLAGSVDAAENGSKGHQSFSTPSLQTTPPAAKKTHEGDASEDLPKQSRQAVAAKIPRNHRFSLLKFRHASDPQLSKSYASSDPSLTPPLPKPTTPTIVTTAPGASLSGGNGTKKDKLKNLGPSQNPSRETIAIDRQTFGPSLDGLARSRSRLHTSDGRRGDANRSHVSFEEPNRSLTLTLGVAPPAYGEVAGRSLALPPSRLSESSRSDASSGDHGIYAETTTTHTVSTTTTIFRLPHRKKNKGHLFPLPVKIPPPEYVDGVRTPRVSRSGRSSISPGRRSPQNREPVTAVYVAGRPAGSDEDQASPLPSPTHSAVAFTHAPMSSTAPSMYRRDSIASHRSAKSTPSGAMLPPFLGSRGRSSTMGSLNKALEAERQPSPQVISSGRTSTSTTGRKSFGDIFSLSYRLRQNSEPSHVGNGKTLSGTPGTPASTASKSNSFQIPREPVVYPERSEGDTPATYLVKLEEAVNRGVIAAILCKGFDEFSKTCLRKYMRGFSYFGDSIDMAVRKMLMEVELPKETQQIDRLLQGFADRYCECNPGIFVSTDEAYFVAFSILLLHSDTHNKNNKRKMQKQDYVKNTQDQVEVSHDILECYYDNVSYTPFIHFEDEVAINSHRLGPSRPKKGLFKAPSTDNLGGPVDPYALILDQKLDLLRPSLKDVMDTEDTYSCTGTVSSMDANGLFQAFHKSGVLQIVSARSRPDAFLSQATISNPSEAQVGLVDIKAAKLGLVWRKDPKKKKARSPWQEWGALLTGSQLYFFRDVAWVKSLISQSESHQRLGPDANPIIFKPPLASFQPDAQLSMDDAVALLDMGYKKHKNAFLFIKHGGFEEVFLANTEAEMNDWIAKLNYAATFRTAGVRMRGFIGANYEGQRPDLGRNDSAASTKSIHTGRGDSHSHGRQINQQLAGEILAYRRQIMSDKITEADDKLATTQKELDNLLRNARHLQICSPIQAKTREALVLAAGRMSAKLKWTRVEMWRTRCHRDVMKMDLEQEIGSSSAASILRESSSARSTPQKKALLRLSTQASSKSEAIKGSDLVASPKTTPSAISSRSTTTHAVLDRVKNPDVLACSLLEGSPHRDHHLSHESADHSVTAGEIAPEHTDQASLLSIRSPAGQSLHHRPSTSSSHLGRSDADSVGQTSRLTTPAPSLDDEEKLLREAGLLDAERTPTALRRPDTSESDHDFASITSLETASRDRIGARRSLHRTLRDSQHTPQSAHSLRHRKGKEPAVHPAPAPASLTRVSKTGAEGLTRSTGSFTVHGKKASVITFGSEWHSMSNEDRPKLRQQAQTDEREAGLEEDTGVLLSPKTEEEEDTENETSVSGAEVVCLETDVDGTSKSTPHEDFEGIMNDSNGTLKGKDTGCRATDSQMESETDPIPPENRDEDGSSTSEMASETIDADAPPADYFSVASLSEPQRSPNAQMIRA